MVLLRTCLNNSSAPSSPSEKRKRKRLRSITPLQTGLANGGELDSLRSPLAKRKKLAADRSGASRLKEGITADDLASKSSRSASNSRQSTPVAQHNDVDVDEMDEEDDEEDDEDEGDEDDFLARELGEEWG